MADAAKISGGVRKAAEHYRNSIQKNVITDLLFPEKKPAVRGSGKAPGLTATQRTQAAGNAVKLREASRRNKTPGMTAQQANELERHSGLTSTLPKRKATPKKARKPLNQRPKYRKVRGPGGKGDT